MAQEHPPSENDSPGPVDTDEFVRRQRRTADLLPDDHGLLPSLGGSGGVPMGPISVMRKEIGPHIGPCALNVTGSARQIMPHPTVVLLWWSAFFWAANVRQQRYILRACTTVMADPAFWTRMSEYGVTGGSFGDSDDLTKYGGGVTSLIEQSIQTKLSSWFNATGVVPDPQTIYIVMLPDGISSKYDTDNNYIGHHQTYQYSGAPVYYGVIEYS